MVPLIDLGFVCLGPSTSYPLGFSPFNTFLYFSVSGGWTAFYFEYFGFGPVLLWIMWGGEGMEQCLGVWPPITLILSA